MSGNGNEVVRRLNDAGVDLGGATETQLEVLDSLSEQEADMLVDVLRRLQEAGPEVTAHVSGGGAFW
jgi:hypothetical protein